MQVDHHPNPYDGVLLHTHLCPNCGDSFNCSDPLCDGKDHTDLFCPVCESFLREIGFLYL